MLDGIYYRSGEEVVFRRVSAPTQTELASLLERIVRRLLKLLTRRGCLVENQGQTYLAGEDDASALSALQGAATSYRIGLGPRRGKKVLTLRTVEADPDGGLSQCAQSNGFSLHAGVSCEADERKKLEGLCRYVAAPSDCQRQIETQQLWPSRVGNEKSV